MEQNAQNIVSASLELEQQVNPTSTLDYSI